MVNSLGELSWGCQEFRFPCAILTILKIRHISFISCSSFNYFSRSTTNSFPIQIFGLADCRILLSPVWEKRIGGLFTCCGDRDIYER